MNILITGGAGFIGSHCAKVLKQCGHQLIVLDNLSRGSSELVCYGPFEKGDCRDELFVREVLEKFQIDSVIHLAGYAYVEESVREPLKYFSNNVGSLNSVLRAMNEVGVKNMVFSSSCTVYGNHPFPVTEDVPLNPQCPYAKSKVFCEKLLAEVQQESGIRSVILRYFNVAGCDADGEIGEMHEPETHILPLMIRAALNGDNSFYIYGSDYPTPDGTCIRDYVHVTDVADAHLRAVEHLNKGGESRVYNLSRGEGISNLELAQAVQKITGQNFKLQFKPRRAGDEPCLIGSASKIQEELGWSPQNSSLENMVQTALQWELLQRHKSCTSRVAPRQEL
ncbi:MAG: UDP-glucose 4-epimerase GalE [Bdellovibrionales bacterium]|nr:UDP-glucose 4-epimerase GalE [Bdellovibrionales bacterium]